MRKITIMIFVFLAANLAAQTKEIKHLVFDSYIPAIVYLDNGQEQPLLMNYSVLTGKMLYMEGGQYYKIDNPQDIAKIKMAGQTFVPNAKVFYQELALASDTLYIEYFGKMVSAGKPDVYGGRSHVSSSVNLNTAEFSDMIQRLDIPDEYKVNTSNKYFVKKEGKFYPFTQVGEIEVVYPNKSKSNIKAYVKESKNRLRTNQDYIDMFNFCISK